MGEATEFQAELIGRSHLCPYTEDKDRGEKLFHHCY